MARKVALVTGGGRNLGWCICNRLGADGYDVVVNVRKAGPGDSAKSQALAEMGARSRIVEADVTKAPSVAAMFDLVEREFGRLDALVHNAAERPHVPFLEMDESIWQRVLEVNLGGAMRCAQRAIPLMLAVGGGSIVNISGVIAYDVPPHASHVAAAKAAVLGLTRGIAAEFGAQGIRANSVVPSSMLTEPRGATEESQNERRRVAATKTALGRIAAMEEVAAVVAFLVSDAASYITGQSIHVNGGRFTP